MSSGDSGRDSVVDGMEGEGQARLGGVDVEAGGGKKAGRVQVQRLKGFRDLMPHIMSVRLHVIDRLRGIFELHGFAPLETPAIEYLSTLEGKYGEEERLIYRFEDHGGRRVGLRYDLTVPLARVVAMHYHELQFPWRRYQIGPVWRGENPQYGRYREFYQCDVDIVGSGSMLADAEVLAIYGEAMQALGLMGYRVLVNNRKLLAGIARSAGVAGGQASSVFRAIDKLEKVGPDAVQEEMVRNGIDEQVARGVLELFVWGRQVKGFGDNFGLLDELAGRLEGDSLAMQGVDELRQIFEALPFMGVELDRYRLEVTLARGLDYYTGPVYEVVVDEPRIGSLGGGGRYDELMRVFSGRDLPTTGGSFGLERIVDVMVELGLFQPVNTPSRALITVFDASPSSVGASLSLAAELRARNIACEVYLNVGDRLSKQLAYADRLGIRYAVVLGPDEVAAGMVTVKDLKAPPPNQRTVLRWQLADVLGEA